MPTEAALQRSIVTALEAAGCYVTPDGQRLRVSAGDWVIKRAPGEFVLASAYEESLAMNGTSPERRSPPADAGSTVEESA